MVYEISCLYTIRFELCGGARVFVHAVEWSRISHVAAGSGLRVSGPA